MKVMGLVRSLWCKNRYHVCKLKNRKKKIPPVYILWNRRNYSLWVANKISSIFFPATATLVPGPNIAKAPASYRYW